MHSAYFESEGGVINYKASAVLSEWLINEDFWDSINQTCGTIFSHYEEDDADVDVCKIIIKQLDSKITSLINIKDKSIVFLYGWDAKKTPQYAASNAEAFINELKELRAFFAKAVELDLPLICCL